MCPAKAWRYTRDTSADGVCAEEMLTRGVRTAYATAMERPIYGGKVSTRGNPLQTRETGPVPSGTLPCALLRLKPAAPTAQERTSHRLPTIRAMAVSKSSL